MEDVDFLFDDTHLERAELERIAKQANKEPVKVDFNAVILRKFTLALINAVAEKQTKETKAKAVEIQPKQPLQKSIINKPIEMPHPELKEEIKKEVEEKKIPVAPIEAPKPEFPEYVIIKNAENKDLVKARLKDHDYFLIEPEVVDKDKELLKKLIEKLENNITKKPEIVNDKTFMVNIVQKFSKKLNIPFNMDYFDKIRYYIVRNTIGYGIIDPLIKDQHIKEIHFIGLHKHIQIAFNEEKNIETNITFENMQDVNNIIKKFFDKAKQKLNRDSNYLDIDIQGVQIKAFYDFDLKESKFDIKK